VHVPKTQVTAFTARDRSEEQRTLQRISTITVSTILHRVTDYDAWRKVYDSFADAQKEGGVTQESVHRVVDDPDDVLVIHHFSSVDAARAFVGRDDLREAMQRGGVQGEQRVELFE
jgi:hypothetical protein